MNGEDNRIRNRILVATDAGLDVYKAHFEAANLSDATLVFTDDPTEAAHLAPTCPIWFGSPSFLAPLLYHAVPTWIQSTWAGVEPYLLPNMPTNYTLTNMRGVFNELAAEFAVGHVFGHAQLITTHAASNVNHQWNAVYPVRVAGKTAGILGVGEIGNEVARLCKAVGMTVFGYTRSSEGSVHVDKYFHGEEELLKMVPLVDYLISILPNTPASSNTLHRGVFEKMKATCVIINLGRGTAIVDDDLLEAIQQGTIGGAVLDVLRHEPLPADHPFWKERNILITSHTAAKTIPEDAFKVFVANYERFRNGEDLKYQIDFARGY